MNGTGKQNPLHRGALTGDDVAPGDKIICWMPGQNASTRHLTIVCSPYQDEDDNWVVDVRHTDGRQTTELIYNVGLGADRYSGEWSYIAIADEEIS